MTDILLAAALLALATVGCVISGWHLTARSTERRAMIAGVVLVVLLVGVLVYLNDSPYLAILFPVPGVVVLGNTVLPLIGLLAGALAGYNARSEARTSRRRWLAPSLLLGVGVVHALRPFWGDPPPTAGGVWKNGVHLQTAEASCSAAAAVTLLARYRIPVTETEMATLCFTRRDGTTLLGVYRGLRQKLDGNGYRVKVLAGATVDELRAAAPALISVGLSRFPPQTVDPRYVSNWGWEPGKRHAVVLFGFTDDGFVDVGDPSVGRERWRVEALDVLWHGEGIYLVPDRAN